MKNLASSYNNQRSTEQTILVYAGSSSNKKSDNDFKYWPEFFNDSAFSHQFSFTVNNKDLTEILRFAKRTSKMKCEIYSITIKLTRK